MVPDLDLIAQTLNKALKAHMAHSGDCNETEVSIQPWFSKMVVSSADRHLMKCYVNEVI